MLLTIVAVTGYGQSSVLSSGNWFKIAVKKHGVYKITYNQLQKLGVSPGKIDPRLIRLYGQEGGMLPQPNATPRPHDLVELAISVSGQEDGRFNKNDFIVFYAQGPDKVSFLPQQEVFSYTSNLYSEKNFYFITLGTTPGKRITTAPPGEGGSPIDHYDDFVYHEMDEHKFGLSFHPPGDPYELKSGRAWYGEQFDLTSTYSFDYTLEGIRENTTITLISDVMAQSFSGSSFKISFNNHEVAQQEVPLIANSTYAPKGRHQRDTIQFNATTVSAPNTSKQRITYTFVPEGSGRAIGFLDYFLLSFKRRLALYGDQTHFRSAASTGYASAQYRIAGMPATGEIWNITNPYEPTRQSFHLESNTALFTSASPGSVEEFIAFHTTIDSPELIGKVANQDLHGMATPNLLILTHPDFFSEAQRLAQHRSATNSWTVAVVQVGEVYHEFSSGRQDITAIRDFVKHLYDKGPSTLKALLLFGKASYDYKNRVSGNTNFVPTYASRNSLDPLASYSSDDYFAFLENDEGEWGESPVQNHSLDIGVGRLPVTTPEEAAHIVDKIIAYETNQKTLGRWRKDIVFVADDGSKSDLFTSIHQDQANAMAETIESSAPEFNTRKIFLGTYAKTVLPNGETIPKANEDITEEFGNALIINYTGHGSEREWADEKIFTEKEIESLENKNYPFLVTATCEFGRHDNPTGVSSAEKCLLKEKSGAIGMVTTARLVNSSTNFSLNQAFYQALLQKESNRYLPLGEVFRRTKNNSTSGVSNRNFSLLGDPSMTLALPSLPIVVTEIRTASGSDTLKALSRVIVKGEVHESDGSVVSDFNGTLEATLFDKRTPFETIGKNDPAYQFEQWFNPLFRGKASVKEGTFAFEFILPKNIAYEINPGKLSLYAADESTLRDASGSSSSFKIGGSEPGPPADEQSPEVKAFMGDTTFINGGTVSSSSMLVVRVKDPSGINISTYGIGNTMMAVLDDDREVYIINDYYVADQDDYTQGWIHFPIHNLEAGKHTLTVKVWDTYNNPGQATVSFVVTDNDLLMLESFGNYPNPFDHKTTFYFTHNRAGDDLQATLILLDMAGQQLKQYDLDIPSSAYQVNLLEVEDLKAFGKKLPQGIYFARLAVRSLSDGSKSERVTKLIVLN